MLDCIRPWGAPVAAFRSPVVVTAVARAAWQRSAYWSLRRRVFADELRVFEADDRDEHDAYALPIVATSVIAGMLDQVVGAVRIYPVAGEEHRWFGGRLAVDPAHRRNGSIGAALIATAVGTAAGRGCRAFFATVQLQNVRYFERRHFRRLHEVSVSGRPHMLMQADLSKYPSLLPPPEGDA